MNIDEHRFEPPSVERLHAPLDTPAPADDAVKCPYRPHDRSDVIDSCFIPEDIALLSLFVRRWTLDREHTS